MCAERWCDHGPVVVAGDSLDRSLGIVRRLDIVTCDVVPHGECIHPGGRAELIFWTWYEKHIASAFRMSPRRYMQDLVHLLGAIWQIQGRESLFYRCSAGMPASHRHVP